MREKPRDRSRLLHMLESINNIEEFIQGKSAEDFQSDKLLYFATVKNLEIIGEAAYMLTNEFRENHPETIWEEIIRMRHILVHGYFQVDSSIVWTTIKNDIQPLRQDIQRYLQEESEIGEINFGG